MRPLGSPWVPHQVDLERARSVGEIARASLTLYVAYPLLFLTLAFAVVGPYEVALLVFADHAPLARGGIPLLGDVLDWTLIGALISALHIHAVAQIGDGQQPRLPDIARRGVAVLPVVAAAVIMSTLGIALGFVLLLIPGIVLSLRWAVAAQAAAIENAGWRGALARSSELTRNNYLHVLAFGFVIGVATTLINLGARVALAGSAEVWYAVVAGILIHTLTRSFAALATAMLFYDLSSRYVRPQRRPSSEHEKPRDLD